ncbi:MAG: ABC transporter permease [Lachnospiraceae bacterium]|nr:ABC transporter permease [Lachnospiraceae bacterium]
MLKKDLKVIFSDKKMLLLLAALIIISVAGVFLCVKESNGPAVKIGVSDNDDTEYSGLLVSYFDKNDVFGSYIQVVRGSDEDMEEQFGRGELDLYLIIPEGFTENLINIVNMPIKAVINSSDKTKAVLLTNLLQSYSDYIVSVEINCQTLYDVMREEGFEYSQVQDVNVEISYDLVFTALGKDDFFERSYIERFEGISLINYYIYSGIMLLVLYAGLFAGLASLKEKLGQTNVRLVSMGVGRAKIFASKLLAYAGCYIVLLAAALLIISMAGELNIPVKAMLFTAASIIVSCVIFMLIAAFIKSVQGYMVLSNMLILLTTIAGGGIIPIMYMPDACVAVARFTPTYWFIKLILGAM